MSRPRSKTPRKRAAGPKVLDVWDVPGPLPDLRAVAPAPDPTSLLRSLGDPPLTARGLPVDEYLYRAVIRASQLASAVANTANLYAPPDDD